MQSTGQFGKVCTLGMYLVKSGNLVKNIFHFIECQTNNVKIVLIYNLYGPTLRF